MKASFEIIDLSQEIFTGMPVFPGLPEVNITIHQTHEELEGIAGSDSLSNSHKWFCCPVGLCSACSPQIYLALRRM